MCWVGPQSPAWREHVQNRSLRSRPGDIPVKGPHHLNRLLSIWQSRISISKSLQFSESDSPAEKPYFRCGYSQPYSCSHYPELRSWGEDKDVDWPINREPQLTAYLFPYSVSPETQGQTTCLSISRSLSSSERSECICSCWFSPSTTMTASEGVGIIGTKQKHSAGNKRNSRKEQEKWLRKVVKMILCWHTWIGMLILSCSPLRHKHI